MFLNGYPYTDFHELNLDFLLQSMEVLKKAFKDFTGANSLVFAEPLLHDLTKQYAKNTIVVDENGDAFISLQIVPAGISLSNSEYWLEVFDFEGYVSRANKNFTDNYFSNVDRSPVSLSVGDWLVLDDILYKVIVAIPSEELFEVGVNIVHFTIEQFLKDFVASINQTVLQYKNDIDESEANYRFQLAEDVASITASLQAQFDQAISGVTVDSEVINARISWNGYVYSTLGELLRNEIGGITKEINKVVDGDWVQGSFVFGTGAETSSTTRLRSKTLVIDSNNIEFYCDDSYYFNVFAWDKTGRYLGVYGTDSVLTKGSASNQNWKEGNIHIPNARYCRLLLSKEDGTTITVADSVNSGIMTYSPNNFTLEDNYDHSGTMLSVFDELQNARLTNVSSNVYHSNKNLATIANRDQTASLNGIDATYNNDGSVTLSGTATADATFRVVRSDMRELIPKGAYTLSGCPAGGSATTWQITIGITGVGQFYDRGSGVTVEVPNDTTYYLNVVVKNGATINDTFYPQLEIGRKATSYVMAKHEIIQADSAVSLYPEERNIFISASSFSLVGYFPNLESINLMHYGAIGDGYNDDGNIINESLLKATGKTLFVPIGEYLTSITINVPSATKIIGRGEKSIFKASDVHNWTRYSWRDYSDAKHKWRYPMMKIEDNANGCILTNFAIKGEDVNWYDQNEDGLCITGNGHVIDNLFIDTINYFPSDFSSRTCASPALGLFAWICSNTEINNCHIYHCGYEDLGFERAENIAVNGGSFGDCNQTRVQIHRNCQHIYISNINIYRIDPDETRPGLTCDAPAGYDMYDIHYDNCTIVGNVNFVGGGEHEIFINGCHLLDGSIVCNDITLYKEKLIISNCQIDNGRIRIAFDKCIIHDNLIYTPANEGWYHMITVFGNDVNAHDNMALGALSNVNIISH